MTFVGLDPDLVVGALLGLLLAAVWALTTSPAARCRQMAAVRRCLR